MDYIEKWPFMVIFQYNLYIFGIHLWTVLYPKPCYNEPCYKEVEVYHIYPKFWDGQAWANSVYPDQMPQCCLWSGAILFATLVYWNR